MGEVGSGSIGGTAGFGSTTWDRAGRAEASRTPAVPASARRASSRRVNAEGGMGFVIGLWFGKGLGKSSLSL